MDAKVQQAYTKRLLEETTITYDSIGKIYCPCLNTNVVFNRQGFHHFKYHGGGEPRTTRDIVYKLKLFPLVIPVLKHARSITGYQQTLEPKNRKHNSLQKEVEYWSLEAEVGRNRDVKIKVILKRVGAGNIIFWSVIRLKK